MSRRPVSSRDRFVSKMTVEDDKYCTRIKEILLGEPCRGIPTEPSQLLNSLYLGNQSNAESLRLLRRLGITHVLNCAGYKGPRTNPHVSPYEGLDIGYYEFQAEDNDCYNISRHFPDAIAFLDKVERKGGKCLVHCAMGVNRSAATCVAYLLHKNWTILKAIKHVKEKRRVCLSNIGFRWQLVKLARSKGLLEKLDDPKPPPKKMGSTGWYDEVVYEKVHEPVRSFTHSTHYQREQQHADRFAEFDTPRRSYDSRKDKKSLSADMSKMDILSKCINETLARENEKTRRAERRYVTRE